MIVVMEPGAAPEQISAVISDLERRGLGVERIDGETCALLHVTSGRSRRARRVLGMEGVAALVPTSGPRYRRVGMPFYPHVLLRWCSVAIVVLGFLTLLAGHFPPGIGLPVDVQHPPATLEVPWYARPLFAWVDLFPPALAWLGWLSFGLVVLLFIAVPRLDRRREGEGGGRALWIVAALIVLAASALAIVRGGLS